ncbi:MAG: recombinase family protein [Candidatus Doudnabacteria bacterium]|nr:recombinase family protein [Candidatus Doudnabacteria bacterium]
MAKPILAITNCRVSSDDQLKNNSLNKQRQSVLAAAEKLGATIPEDGQWSGSVSSLRGKNVKRKDILAMLEYCNKHKDVKYLIVDEPDRFMRSIDEAYYIEMQFKLIGVMVWYASDNDLNSDQLQAKLMKFMKYFVAEGSNEERQRKSINGQVQALREGRYTFHPKPGYIRGERVGVHEIDPIRGPLLKEAMLSIINRISTPTQALIELNKTDFVKSRAPYKMDKFRKILTDPFYSGVVESNKQVCYRNEQGLHEPLISAAYHNELVKIMAGNPKNQSGPRKNGNPKYPLNNLITHDTCAHKQYGRVVGVDINNGKNKAKIYEKYRCRACRSSIPREDLHAKVQRRLNHAFVSQEGLQDLLDALEKVWSDKEGQRDQASHRLRIKAAGLAKDIERQVEAVTDPENAVIHQEILQAIKKKKSELIGIEAEIEKLNREADYDKQSFLRFAFEFTNNMGTHFLSTELSDANRKRCKQIIFPGGFYLDTNQNVYTPEISPLITLATNKKDLPKTEKSFMVRVRGL